MTSLAHSPASGSATLRDVQALCDRHAVEDPPRFGYGYHETQHAWRYDPAFELPRIALFELVTEIAKRGLHGACLQIGLGKRGGTHWLLDAIFDRVVTVEIDRARIETYRATHPNAEDSAFLCGDSLDPATVERARASMPECDLLLIDGQDTHEAVRADWFAYAGFVRPGGLVALVDSSQMLACDDRPSDVDRFVIDLDTRVLAPNGVRLMRFGSDRALFVYEQPAEWSCRDFDLPLPALPTPTARLVGEDTRYGMRVFEVARRVVAIPAVHDRFDPREAARSTYDFVLGLSDVASAPAEIEAFAEGSAQLERARQMLVAGDVAAAREVVAAVTSAFPDLRAILLAAQREYSFARDVLVSLGVLSLFDGRLDEGIAWLDGILRREASDSDVVRTLAATYTNLIDDPARARELLAFVRSRVDAAKLRDACRDLGGSVLWRYPSLIEGVAGVIHVGAHRGESVGAYARVRFERQLFLEPQPDACRALEATCEHASKDDVCERRVLQVAVGSAPASAFLHVGEHSERATLFAPRAMHRPRAVLPVELTTLDALLENGVIDPDHYQLLVVDTEGAELEVLRGARELLRHVEVVCVSVFYEPLYEGAPLPTEISAFLAEVDDYGFGLKAHEPGPDPRRGDAIYYRNKRRRSQRR